MSWDERALPSGASYPAISFVSDKEGWLASGDPQMPCAINGRSLWRTDDGANTWQEVGLSSLPSASCGASLSFVQAQRGYLAALDPHVGPLVYRTTDAGTTWLPSSPLSDPPDLPMQGGRADIELGPVGAYGATLLLASRVRSASIVPTQYVYASQDAGASWRYAASVPVIGGFAFVTMTRWLRLGPAGASVETTDAGVSWHAYETDYTQAAPSSPELVFADANVGYAIVRGAIQRTTDGGAHWISVVTPGTR